MICKNCGAENIEGSTFCASCGARIDGKKRCASCGRYVLESAVFCPDCGARMDGKKACPGCGALVESEQFCPVCGYKLKEQPKSKNVVKADKKKKVAQAGGWILFSALIIALICSLFDFATSISSIFNFYVISNIISVCLNIATIVLCIIAIVAFFKQRRNGGAKFNTLYAVTIALFAVGTLGGYGSAFDSILFSLFNGNITAAMLSLGVGFVVPVLRSAVALLTLIGCLLYSIVNQSGKTKKELIAKGVLCPIGAYTAIEAAGYYSLYLWAGWAVIIHLLAVTVFFFVIFAFLKQTQSKANALGIVFSAIAILLAIMAGGNFIVDSILYVIRIVIYAIPIAYFVTTLVLSIINLSFCRQAEKADGTDTNAINIEV